jgi:hypothetical protein
MARVTPGRFLDRSTIMTHPTTFTTPKGTKLPLLDLRGKEYLQVAHRLVWFREEHPEWSIETEPLAIQADYAIFTARVKNEQGRVIATGTKHETRPGFLDFIEKAETGAIGRALALCGYGTQFAPELDEGERIVDSPVTRPNGGPAAQPAIGTAWRNIEFRPTGPAATSRQVSFVIDLAVRKLAARAGDEHDAMARLAERFGPDLKSPAELSRARARMIIQTLQGMPDAPPTPFAEETLLDFDESA